MTKFKPPKVIYVQSTSRPGKDVGFWFSKNDKNDGLAYVCIDNVIKEFKKRFPMLRSKESKIVKFLREFK